MAASTHADLEAALMAWADRLAAKQRDLHLLQHNLIELAENLTKMARIIDEVRALQQGEPIAQTATVVRPALKLVPRPERDDR